MRPTFAQITLSNLKFNFLNVRRKVGSSKVMAVVKADAYGHGVKMVCQTLNSLKNKPEYYAVANVEEGAELRRYKIKQPILVFEPVTQTEAGILIKHNLTATVFEIRHLKILDQANNKSRPVNVHIKIDTGMHRLGVCYDEAYDFIKKVSLNKKFNIDGIYTHFATSDEKNKSYANIQIEKFTSLINRLREDGVNYGLAHSANSGAIMDLPESYLDMVRLGISLYGYYPSKETSESIKLKPVMSIYSIVNSIMEVKQGESISYGRRYFTDKETKIAAVPIGYADGFRRDLTNKAYAIINNKIYPQVGTVTMDRIMFNIGKADINVGDKVILLGNSKDQKVDAWDWSNLINTIPYEITCGISKRVKRVYK